MAGTSLFALLDDIASILDDVATMTKVATKKTAGVLGDDLALNAEQVSGVKADRELSVVWGVAKGSAKNKLILVPSALLLSTIAPVPNPVRNDFLLSLNLGPTVIITSWFEVSAGYTLTVRTSTSAETSTLPSLNFPRHEALLRLNFHY